MATTSVAAAYALAFFPTGGGRISAALMIFGIALMTISIMMLGASRTGHRLGILGWAFAAVFMILVAGFGLALVLPAEGATAKVVLGLPARAAIVIYAIGFLPVFILPLVYALTFEERTLSEDDLKKVRDVAAEHRHERASSE